MTQTTPQPSELLDAFLEDSWDALEHFDNARAVLASRLEPHALEELRILSHRMRGTSAQYGFPQLSRLTELAEKVCEGGPHLSEAERPELLNFLEQTSAVARTAVDRVAHGLSEGDVGLNFSSLGGSRSLEALLVSRPGAFTHRSRPLAEVEDSAASGLDAALRRFYLDNTETWEYFAPEAHELLEELRTTLEPGIEDLGFEALSTLFRSTHTLKGSAYMVGLEPMGLLAHRLEDLMSAVRDGERDYSTGIGAALLSGHEALEAMLDSAEGRSSALEARMRAVLALLEPLLGSEALTDLHALLGAEGPQAALPLEADASTLADQLGSFFVENLEFWGDFAAATRERVEALRELLGSETTPDIHAVLRTVHGLKSEARALEVPGITVLSGQLEDLFAGVRDLELDLDPAVLETAEAVLTALDHMLLSAEGSLSVQELEDSQRRAQSALAAYLDPAPVQSAAPGAVQTPRAQNRSIRVTLEKLDRLMNLVGEMVGLRSRFLSGMGRMGEVSTLLEASRQRMNRTVSDFETKYLNPRLAAMTPAKASSRPEQPSTPGQSRLTTVADQWGDLEFDTYSDLNILARSVLEMGEDLSEVAGQLEGQLGGLREETERLMRLSRQMRDEVQSARMVPLTGLFSRLSRLVRSGESGKLFRFQTSGETVEVDNFVLEEVLDPLLHLIRNAVYHGIETREERLGKGKSAEGHIWLRAQVSGGSVILEVEDDGRGLQLEAIRRSALERGLRSPEALAALSDEETVQLIFAPGLSTARQVTVEAGRGVGMDAVAVGVRRLGGDISVSSEAQLGTRFTLRLPLTLVVSQAMLVESGGQTFALPAPAVRQVRFTRRDELEVQDGVPVLRYEGAAIRLLELGTLLGLSAPSEALEELPTVVLELAGERVAVAVDAFVGLEEIVQKPLSRALTSLSHLAGASVASSGEVILILDPSGMVRLAEAGALEPGQRSATVGGPSLPEQTRRLLLVDDSVSVRRIVAKMLSRAGYEVVTAVDGQDALELLRRDRDFFAVLSDLEMPRLNGYELIESLKAREETHSIPVVVMTTRAGEKHRDLAFRLGASEYFSKPIEEGRLLGFLRSLGTLALAS